MTYESSLDKSSLSKLPLDELPLYDLWLYFQVTNTSNISFVNRKEIKEKRTVCPSYLLLPLQYKSRYPKLCLLLPLNPTFNSHTKSIYVNKRFQCLIQVRLYYRICRVILAIDLLNLKEFLTLIELPKCHNVNYKAFLLCGTKLN